ncbi:MAG: gliding motility-associated C-terminal domain-containing protein [Flavobacteriales bacterium]|nr:gliding motility-associated C-terminal domain-containing protein [Flavobacteriales bacterium]
MCDIGGAVNLFAQLGGGPTAGGAWSGPSPVVGGNYDPATMAPGVYTYTVNGIAPCANASATVTVAEVDSPNAGVDASVTLCSAGAQADLFALLGPTADAGGTWSGPSALNGGIFDPASMLAGAYTYAINATAPCIADAATVSISIETAPDAGSPGSIQLCPGSPAVTLFSVLGGTPQAGGTWAGPGGVAFDGVFDPGSDPAGDHTYTITGTVCASASAVVSVVVLPGPDAGDDNAITLCSTNAAFNLITQLMGTPDAGGVWTDVQGDVVGATFDPAASTPGTFTYTVAGSANCPDESATLAITVNAAPQAGTGGNLTLCASSAPVALFDGLSGTLDIGGSWTAPDGSAHGAILDPAADASGTYTYTVQGNAPCVAASATVEVLINPVPFAGEDGNLVLCTSGPVVNLITSLGGSPQAGGSWTAPNGAPSNGSFAPATGQAGAYTYTITGIAPCVDDASTVTIVVSVAADAGTGSSLSLCDGDAAIDLFAQLGGTPDATGTWTGPDGLTTDSTFDPLADVPGDYVYTVTPSAPCPVVSSTMSMSVVMPVVTSFLASSLGTCAPLEVTFSHDYTGPGTCTWILGNGDVIEDCAPVTVIYTDPGSYDVTLIVDANNGCGADTVTIADAVNVYAQPTAAFEMLPAQLNTLDPQAFFNNLSSGALSYEWLINEVFITDEEDMTHFFTGDIGADYGICLVAIAAGACADTSCLYITVEDGMRVWVPNTFTPDGNEHNNTFKPIVTGIDRRFYLFEIYDRWGLRLFSTTDPDAYWDGTVDGAEAVQDVYVWQLKAKDAYSAERVERIGHVTLLR